MVPWMPHVPWLPKGWDRWPGVALLKTSGVGHDLTCSSTESRRRLFSPAGIGPKTASRLTFFLLNAPEDVAGGLAEALHQLKANTVDCRFVSM